MNKFKNTKAITLIALVITIVVLLILSGISIQAITNTGLFGKAKQAAQESKYANAAEKVALAVNASYDSTGKMNDDYLKENVNKIDGLNKKVDTVTYDLKIVVDGFEFTISEYGKITGEKKEVATLPDNTPQTDAGKEVKLPSDWGTQTVSYIKTTDGTEVTTLETVATVYAVSDGQNNTVPVPYNFYYVGGTKATGIVISDNEADKYEKGKDKTSHDYATQLKGNQFVWIPCTIDEYKKIDWGKENAKWDKETNVAENSQIEKYGGFYVGRYEAGVSTLNEITGQFEDSVIFDDSKSLFNVVGIQSDYYGWGFQNYDYTARQKGTSVTTGSNKATGNIVEKANSIPYYHADYYTAVEMTRRMYKDDGKRNKYVTSGLITGTQWDMMCKYMQDNGVDITLSDCGNYDDISLGGTESNKKLRGYYTNMINNGGGATDGFTKIEDVFTTNSGTGSYVLLTTGSTEQVKKMNLYDVAGNLWEWSQETAYRKDLKYNLNENFNSYMLRGGGYDSTYLNCPVYDREYDHAVVAATSYGFRPVLYIK